MVKVKTLPPITCHHVIELRAAPRALAVLWTHPCAVGWPKATGMGQLPGPWPSRPLWMWAAVKPKGIVDFPFFLELFKYSSNKIRFDFEFISNLFKLEN
jgi:hypothetical protein